MNKKDELIGLGLLGIPFICVGVGIGGFIINKINNKFENKSTKTWMDLADHLRIELFKSYDEIQKLKKELEDERKA